MKFNFHLESDEDIVTHATNMSRLDDTEIASTPNNPQHFQEHMQYLYKEDNECLALPTKLTALQ